MHVTALSLVLAAVLAAGCVGDPPRDNPFDPLADNFDDVGTATGSVTRFYSPEGIAGARVRLIPLSEEGAERVVQTEADGRFMLPNVPTGTYLVIADAEGYAPATDTLVVPLGATAEADALALDGIPTVSEQTVRTANIERWFPDFPLENLIVEVAVSDPDGLGDIDRVAVAVPELGFADTLRVIPETPNRYRRTFIPSELGHPLSTFLGRTIEVTVVDRVGVTGFAPGVQVLRIVDVFPQPISPLNAEDFVGPTPLLVWVPLVLPYPFTYTVEVKFVPAPGQEVVVQSFEALPPTQNEVQITTPLENGQYIWVVSVIDQFGNRSQMKNAGFTVLNSPVP